MKGFSVVKVESCNEVSLRSDAVNVAGHRGQFQFTTDGAVNRIDWFCGDKQKHTAGKADVVSWDELFKALLNILGPK